MPPEEREQIFRRFHRGRDTRGQAGFGLGLAIGRELAGRMGGELVLEDTEPGTGATFTLRLPAPPRRRPGRCLRRLADSITAHGSGADAGDPRGRGRTTGGTAGGGGSSGPSSIGCPLPRPAEVLDAGCGSGRTLLELVDYGARRGHRARPRGGRGGPRPGPRARSSRAASRSCPGAEDSFDLITCLDVIEHTPDDRRTLAELRRVCRPGRLPARHRARLPVPVVRPRRGSTTTTAATPRRLLRERRAGRGLDAWSRMSAFNSLLLAPAAVVRLARRGSAATGDARRRTAAGRRSLHRPALAQRRARGAAARSRRAGWRAAHAAGWACRCWPCCASPGRRDA